MNSLNNRIHDTPVTFLVSEHFAAPWVSTAPKYDSVEELQVASLVLYGEAPNDEAKLYDQEDVDVVKRNVGHPECVASFKSCSNIYFQATIHL